MQYHLQCHCLHCRSLAVYELDDHINEDALELIKPIGSGSFGIVHEARYHGASVAVKVLTSHYTPYIEASGRDIQEAARQESFRLMAEARKLRTLRHPNVVYFYGYSTNPLRLITEYCPRGSLEDIITRRPEEISDWKHKFKLALGIVSGMNYLVNRTNGPILHRDLKSANILVSESGEAIICDVGMSRFVRIEDQFPYDPAGSRNLNFIWQAPEVILNRHYSEKSEVFSAAVIMWELMMMRRPYDIDKTDVRPFILRHSEIATQIAKEGRRPFIPENREEIPGYHPVLEKYIELLNRCWSYYLDERPTFSQLGSELREIESEFMEAVREPPPVRIDNTRSVYFFFLVIAAVSEAVLMVSFFGQEMYPTNEEIACVVFLAAVALIARHFLKSVDLSALIRPFQMWTAKIERQRIDFDMSSSAGHIRSVRSPFEIGEQAVGPPWLLSRRENWRNFVMGFMEELANDSSCSDVLQFCCRHMDEIPSIQDWIQLRDSILKTEAAANSMSWRRHALWLEEFFSEDNMGTSVSESNSSLFSQYAVKRDFSQLWISLEWSQVLNPVRLNSTAVKCICSFWEVLANRILMRGHGLNWATRHVYLIENSLCDCIIAGYSFQKCQNYFCRIL